MCRRLMFVAALMLLSVSSLSAQQAAPASAGSDPQLPVIVDEVPYIRTPQAVVDKMLELAEVGLDDFVVDLGSGDGRIVITAAKERGASGFGVELMPRLVAASNEAARKAGVADRASFFVRDLFATDLRAATVLTMYLLPEINLALRPRLLEQLQPGTRVVSHDWDMGEWRPDDKAVISGLEKEVMPQQASTVYLWIVPAKVAGVWRVQAEASAAFELEFTQRFQEISGIVSREGGRSQLQSTYLRGAEVRFSVVDDVRRPAVPEQFFGRVYGDTMEGSTGSGKRWRAERVLRGIQQ